MTFPRESACWSIVHSGWRQEPHSFSGVSAPVSSLILHRTECCVPMHCLSYERKRQSGAEMSRTLVLPYRNIEVEGITNLFNVIISNWITCVPVKMFNCVSPSALHKHITTETLQVLQLWVARLTFEPTAVGHNNKTVVTFTIRRQKLKTCPMECHTRVCSKYVFFYVLNFLLAFIYCSCTYDVDSYRPN